MGGLWDIDLVRAGFGVFDEDSTKGGCAATARGAPLRVGRHCACGESGLGRVRIGFGGARAGEEDWRGGIEIEFDFLG
jgi:hypothetical protein